MSTRDEKAVTRRAKVASGQRMSKFLRHFTVVGDDYQAWNINYKKWENEEEEDEEEQQLPSTPASGEEGRAAGPDAAPVPAPRAPPDFRSTLRKLFSSHRFQCADCTAHTVDERVDTGDSWVLLLNKAERVPCLRALVTMGVSSLVEPCHKYLRAFKPSAGLQEDTKAKARPRARTLHLWILWLGTAVLARVIIICLVVLDALLVLAELILDLKIIQPDKNNYAARVFHYMSIAILVFFMMEIFFKIFVFRLEFFHHKFEILDAIVVVVSFVLDIVLLFREHEFEALGLLILLRLWRVARIINGIIISVKTRSERQLLRLKQRNIQLAAKIQHLEFNCCEKEQEIDRLNKLLRQHGLLGEVN